MFYTRRLRVPRKNKNILYTGEIKKMKELQKILFPSTQNCVEETMFFRKNGQIKYSLADDRIYLRKNAMLSFDTYFNAFFANTWLKYTKVDNVFLRLYIKGKVRISLILQEKNKDGLNEKCVYESYFDSNVDGDYFDGFFDTPRDGAYSFRILCLSDNAQFISGFYYTDDEFVQNDIDVNLYIKLSKYDRYVYRNVSHIENDIISDKSSDIAKKIHIYVEDYNKILLLDKMNKPYASVISSDQEKNIFNKKFENNKSSYTVLLDDDVLIQTESIVKIFTFLSSLKKEYRDVFISGNVFRTDWQWDCVMVDSDDSEDKHYDMRSIVQCIENAEYNHKKYAAWWCGVVPTRYLLADTSVFEKRSDNVSSIISFNGLCVWHEKIDSLKQSNWYTEYIGNIIKVEKYENECILQHFLFPQESNCTEESLYFRRIGVVDYSLADDGIKIRNNGIVNFDTYFNGLSASKWMKYTNVKKVKVHLDIKGRARISLLYKEKTATGILEKCIYETYFDSDRDGEQFIGEYKTEFINGMYCVSILSMSDNTKFFGGYFYTTDANVKDIGLAINICTFKREKYVYKNMKMLEEEFLLNEDSELRERLYINISDNAKTLDPDNFSSSHIKVFENRNLGGAGGFTRAMIESKKMEKACRLTHVLVMDDDVVMQPESIYRTYRILSLVKDEYKDAFIGGAMLRTDWQWFQTEAGGTWNAGRLVSHKQGLDLRVLDACLYNEVEEKCDFNAWWYCTMPIGVITDKNLPMPIFIRGDDVEFGLRNMKHLILMNGICVWHEPFENKYSSSMYYYIFRNRLIDNAVRDIDYSKESFLSEFKDQYFREVFTLRYKNAQLLLDGVYDFLKGPEWLMSQNGDELNMDVMSRGYKFTDLNNLSIPFDYPQYEQMLRFVESPEQQKKRKRTLNGLMGAHDKAVCVPVQNPHIAYFYKAYGAVNYDPVSGRGFETYFDKKEEINLLKAYFKLKKAVNKEYDSAKSKYLEARGTLNGMEFWKEYLGI